jgi:putative membrane protein
MADPVTSAASSAQINTELAMRNTGMAFQRTRMGADRTLMAVIRTSLALIGFGFTIFKFFEQLQEARVLKGAASARNFGASLAVLGIVLLILGIGYHIAFMLGLRRERRNLRALGLIHAESGFPTSLVLIVAVSLLLIGVVAVISMVGQVGPYE